MVACLCMPVVVDRAAATATGGAPTFPLTTFSVLASPHCKNRWYVPIHHQSFPGFPCRPWPYIAATPCYLPSCLGTLLLLPLPAKLEMARAYHGVASSQSRLADHQTRHLNFKTHFHLLGSSVVKVDRKPAGVSFCRFCGYTPRYAGMYTRHTESSITQTHWHSQQHVHRLSFASSLSWKRRAYRPAMPPF